MLPIVIRLLGSVFKTFFIKSRTFEDMKPGSKKSQARIFLYSLDVFLSSKGRYPQVMAYRMMPLLHMSELKPSYFFPAIISGDA